MNKLKSIDQEYVLQTYNRNYINFISGKNATLKDEYKRKYIDFTSGIGVVSVGHGNRQVAKKIYTQVSNITHISNLYLIEPQALLAKELSSHFGYKYHSFFANSGAEANEGAIKIARKYGEVNGKTKRYKIITLDNSFHGRTITALKATAQVSMHNYFGPFPDGFEYAKNIDDIYNKIDSKTIAVMIELIQGEGGVELQNIKAVQKLAKFLKSKDILLIIDEVQTGVYRTGEFLASNIYNIKPDIITLAKGLGGGIPIGVVMSKNKKALVAGEHGSTFGGNFLSTRASLEVLKILQQLYTSKQLNKTVKYFENNLEEIALKYKDIFIKRVGFGLMQGLRLRDSSISTQIIESAFEQQLLILKAGRGTIRFLPPLTITKTEIDLGFKKLKKALKNI